MTKRATRDATKNPARRSDEAEAVEAALRRTFTAAVVDELRQQTGYNPRQRLITAQRLMLVVVEAFLMGQTLGFSAIRAIFVRRFGFIRPCPFQKRFKQSGAAAFFRAALERLVASVVNSAGLCLSGPLAQFGDVRVYDGTGQRVPPRGRKALPGCTKGKAGSKWVAGYSIKTGLLEHAECGAETASETPLWRKLVPSFTRGALYLFDLGFFERNLFAAAQDAGAHVLMRLKKTAKVRVIGHVVDRSIGTIPGWAGTRRLPEAIGVARAKQMIFSGARIDAATAERWGLVNEIVPHDRLLARAEDLARLIAANAPVSVQLAKAAIDGNADATEAIAGALAASTDDGHEGVAAFREKRKAEFRGH